MVCVGAVLSMQHVRHASHQHPKIPKQALPMQGLFNIDLARHENTPLTLPIKPGSSGKLPPRCRCNTEYNEIIDTLTIG